MNVQDKRQCDSSIAQLKAEIRECQILECTSEECAYNNDGVCRFHKVKDRPPVITEEDGCTEGVFCIF